MLTDRGESECFKEVMSYQHKSEWVKTMQKEMKSLNENNPFNLMKLPKRKITLKNKWVYRLMTENNSQQWYKVGLVAKWFYLEKMY